MPYCSWVTSTSLFQTFLLLPFSICFKNSEFISINEVDVFSFLYLIYLTLELIKEFCEVLIGLLIGIVE